MIVVDTLVGNVARGHREVQLAGFASMILIPMDNFGVVLGNPGRANKLASTVLKQRCRITSSIWKKSWRPHTLRTHGPLARIFGHPRRPQGRQTHRVLGFLERNFFYFGRGLQSSLPREFRINPEVAVREDSKPSVPWRPLN